MKKTLLMVGVATGTLIGGTILLTAPHVFAQNMQGQETLVQMIADKFHLNKTDVQSVFDQYKEQHKAQMQDKIKSRLDQAVKDGKLTSQQEQLILDKVQELQNNRQSEMEKLKNMSPEDRKAYRLQQMQSLKDWAQKNNIDLKYLMGGMGMKGRVWKGM